MKIRVVSVVFVRSENNALLEASAFRAKLKTVSFAARVTHAEYATLVIRSMP